MFGWHRPTGLENTVMNMMYNKNTYHTYESLKQKERIRNERLEEQREERKRKEDEMIAKEKEEEERVKYENIQRRRLINDVLFVEYKDNYLNKNKIKQYLDVYIGKTLDEKSLPCYKYYKYKFENNIVHSTLKLYGYNLKELTNLVLITNDEKQQILKTKRNRRKKQSKRNK